MFLRPQTFVLLSGLVLILNYTKGVEIQLEPHFIAQSVQKCSQCCTSHLTADPKLATFHQKRCASCFFSRNKRQNSMKMVRTNNSDSWLVTWFFFWPCIHNWNPNHLETFGCQNYLNLTIFVEFSPRRHQAHFFR